MTRNAVCTAIAAVVFLVPVAYGDQVIDPLNDNANVTWRDITGDVTAYSWVTDIPPGLTGNSAQLEFPNGYVNWWGALQGEYATPLDLSQETHIRFWAKVAAPGALNPHVRLIFITGSWGTGGSHATTNITDTWQQYEIPIANFVPDPYYQSSGGTNTTPVDWSNVGTFQYAVGYSAGLDPTPNTFWIDHIEAVGALGVNLVQVTPAKGASVSALPTISVTFNKNVTGVDAGDLTVNGSAATVATGSGTGPYVFSGYAQPGVGTANVVMASGGITAGAEAFPGDAWTYQVEDWMMAIAPLALQPVTLDGTLSPGEWDDANHYYFDGTSNATRPGWADPAEITADDWSCTFSVKHDADYIYIAAYVYDDILIADGPDAPDYRDDRWEMYFDPDNSDSSGIQPGGANEGIGGWQITYDGRNYGGTWFVGFQTFWWGAATSDSVHVTTYEFRVAKEITSGTDTINMVTGGTYGFDLSPDDADTPADVRDTQIWWNSQVGTAWNNEPTWGDIYLDPNPLVLPIPGQVQNLQGVGGDQYARLSWDPIQFATQYNIYQGDTTGGPYTLVTTSTATTNVRVDGLQNLQTYYFRVSAENPSGEGPQSAELELLITGQSLRARSWREYR